MKKKGIVYLTVLALMCGLLVGCGGHKEKENMKIYYINALGDGIGAVGYHMHATKTDAMIDEALQELGKDPDSVEYRRTISDSVKIEDCALDDGMLSLYFDREYEELTGYTEVLMRAAIVKTLVQIKGIDSVTFYVGGDPLQDANGTLVGSMNDDTFINDYGAETGSLEKTKLTLYFASADGQSLVKKEMDVYYNKNVARERLIMDYLLKGSDDEDAKTVFPSGTKLLNVTVTDGVCYVNLDSSFLKGTTGVNSKVVLYSIVNSLTELDNINKVQILVEGAQSTSADASLGFSLGTSYERDTSMVMQAVERDLMNEGQ